MCELLNDDDEFRAEAETLCREFSGDRYEFVRRVSNLEVEVLCIPAGVEREHGIVERWNLLEKMVELRLSERPELGG